jgi:hypothetical protein
MTYFKDLSDYSYHRSEYGHPGTKNVGWLGAGHEFERVEPTDKTLGRISRFCKISVVLMRGFHECEFCRGDANCNANYFERNGEKLRLGCSEIRVFSRSGVTYAASTLIYHYMKSHHYRPPDEFLQALDEGPIPPDQEYFDRLDEAGLKWTATPRMHTQDGSA